MTRDSLEKYVDSGVFCSKRINERGVKNEEVRSSL